MNEWNIQSRAHACQSCGKAFADKQLYHTILSDEKTDFCRTDVCTHCWQQQYSQGASDRKGFISQWQGIYEAPPAAPPDAIKKETAETLLRKVIEANDPKNIPAAFILAVMLERKRILKIKEQFNRDGQRVFVYEQPKTGDIFTITDPNLQLNQLEQVQRDVALLLESGFPDESAPATAAAVRQPEAAPAEASAPEQAGDPAVAH